MYRHFNVPLLTFFFLVIAVSGCCRLLGNPQDPYPRKSPPQIGQIVHLATGTLVSPVQMMAVIEDARIVYVGETHDNPASHRLELQVLQALAKRYPDRLAFGMEMFERAQQPVLDRWVAGELDEKAFLKESRWFESWNMDFAYYRELLSFAREQHIPVIALNTKEKLVKALRSHTPDQLSREDQTQLPELDFSNPYEHAFVAAIFGDHSRDGMQLDGFYRAQVLRDEAMAESAARYLTSPAGQDKHLLVVAGGDHVRNGFGIPRRVFRRIATSYVIIGGEEINIPPDKQDRLMNVAEPDFPMLPYDFLVYQAYEDLPEKGVRLGVLVEVAANGRGLIVKNVLPDSNAERSGLKSGDLLLTIDGDALASNFDLIYAVQQRHPGDHVILKIERHGSPLNVDIIFQAVQEDHKLR